MTAQHAASMMVEECDCGCGGMRLSLMDRDGQVFAVAEIDRNAALCIASQIVDSVIDDDDDEIGEVAGHA